MGCDVWKTFPIESLLNKILMKFHTFSSRSNHYLMSNRCVCIFFRELSTGECHLKGFFLNIFTTKLKLQLQRRMSHQNNSHIWWLVTLQVHMLIEILHLLLARSLNRHDTYFHKTLTKYLSK